MSKQLTATIKMVETVSSSMRDVSAAATEASASVDSVSVSVEEAASRNDTLEDSLGSLGETAREASAGVEDLGGDANSACKGLENLGDRAEQSESGVSGLGEKTASLSDDLRDLSEETDRSAQSINDLGSVLAAAGITVGLKEVAEELLDCVSAANEFSTAFAKVTTIADTSDVSLSQIRAEIKSLSTETAQSVGEISEATYQAISASIDTADAVEFVGEANKLAVGGFTETTTAVDVLTTALNAYQMEADEAARVSDVLITTQNLGKTSVGQLADSVGKVIPLASAYNVEIENLGTAYAVLTANGIATAEAGTYLKSILNELGSDSSEVAQTLREETGASFTELMAQGYSLGDALEVIGDSVNGDTTAFSNMWSSVEAGVGALSLFNAGAVKYNSVLSQMEDASGATTAAYETMTDTAEFAGQQMSNAAANLEIAIGDQLSPAVQTLESGISSVLSGMTDIVEENPVIVSTAAAAAAGIAALTLAVTAYTVKATLATKATVALAAAKAALSNPVTLVVAGVAAAAVGLAVMAANADDAADEYDALTASSKEQYDEIQRLNEEYKSICATYGETSYEAQSLQWKIDDLTDSFEASKITVDAFNQQLADSKENFESLHASYSDSTYGIEQEEQSVSALALKLGELSEKSEKTAEDQAVISAIVDNLNEKLPDLALNYNAATDSLNMTADAIVELARAEAARKQHEEDYAYLTQLIEDQCSAEKNLKKANEDLSAAQSRETSAQNALSKAVEAFNKGEASSAQVESLSEAHGEAYEALMDAAAAAEEAQRIYDDYGREIETTAEKLRGYTVQAEAAEEATNGITSAMEGVSFATEYIDGIREDVDALIESYNNSYDAAYTAITNTVGLFQTMSTEVTTSTDKMMEAMQSQQEWISNYTANLKSAAEYGISEGLVAALSDGSTESAGYLQAIIDKIEALGTTQDGLSTEAADFVKDFNDAYKGVETAKSEFSNQVAEMENNFSDAMDDITEKMIGTIDEMDMSTEAAQKAAATMQAYVDGIYDSIPAVQTAFGIVSSFFPTSQTPIRYGLNVDEFNAAGTDNASDVFVAGEEGPELIIGAGGAKVLPNDETMRVLSGSTFTGGVSYDSNTQDKNITLHVEGGGTIRIKANAPIDKDELVDLLYDEMRPVLIDIIESEIEEEGESVYGF